MTTGFDVHLTIDHAWIGSLTIVLKAPDGTAYTLRDKAGEADDDLDETYRIVDLGLNPTGTWTLSISDDAFFFDGTMTYWSLHF
ncbi:proprotein convertase P-domain-containing protein [Kibdelosporangium aridum]|uniref:proprotein convertase P-domain-containing protein n=1 Tax=Kibdelosporangium aridum TaxID=2030 RepID=UPI000524312A